MSTKISAEAVPCQLGPDYVGSNCPPLPRFVAPAEGPVKLIDLG